MAVIRARSSDVRCHLHGFVSVVEVNVQLTCHVAGLSDRRRSSSCSPVTRTRTGEERSVHVIRFLTHGQLLERLAADFGMSADDLERELSRLSASTSVPESQPQPIHAVHSLLPRASGHCV